MVCSVLLNCGADYNVQGKWLIVFISLALPI